MGNGITSWLRRRPATDWIGASFFIVAVAGVPLAGAAVVTRAGGATPSPARALLAPFAGLLEERGLRNVERYAAILEDAAAESEVPVHLLGGIMFAESRGRSGQRSGAGALGLMQLVPASARDAARRLDCSLPSEDADLEAALLDDDTLNVRLGAAHLAWLLRHRGDWSLEAVLVSYNAGRAKLFRWIDRHGSYGDWVAAEEARGAAGERTTGALAYARQVLRARDALAERGKF